MLSTKPLSEEEKAVVRYIWSPDPPATEPVPQLLSDSLRRIVESSNPMDTFRHEIRAAAELTRRHDIERGAILEAGHEPGTSIG